MTRSYICLSVVLVFLAGAQRTVASVGCPAFSDGDRDGWMSEDCGCDFGACVADIHPFSIVAECDPGEPIQPNAIRRLDYRSGHDPVYDMAVYGSLPADAAVPEGDPELPVLEPSAVSTDCDEYTMPGSYDSYYDDYEYGYANNARPAEESAEPTDEEPRHAADDDNDSDSYDYDYCYDDVNEDTFDYDGIYADEDNAFGQADDRDELPEGGTESPDSSFGDVDREYDGYRNDDYGYDFYEDGYEYGFDDFGSENSPTDVVESTAGRAVVDLSSVAHICRRTCEGLWDSCLVVSSRNLMRHASELASGSVSHWDVEPLWRMVQENTERLATEHEPGFQPISEESNYSGLQESDPNWYGDCECWGFEYSACPEPRIAVSDLERLLLAGPRRQVALNVAERLDRWGQALQHLSGQIRGLAAGGDVGSTSLRPSTATLK